MATRSAAGLAALALALAACAAPGASPPAGSAAPSVQPSQPASGAPEAKVVKIGVEGPFTGPSARTGQEIRGSVELAFEKIGYKVGDYTIEPVWIDDQSDPEKGSRAYEEAVVGQGIVAGLLGWHSSVAVAQMEIAAKHKVPHFFHMGATGVVNEKFHSDQTKYGYWTSKGWPEPSKLSIAYVNALEDAIRAGKWSPPEKKVAIYGEDTDWGRSFGGAIKEQFEAAGWTVVSEDYFAKEQTEFTPLLTRYKDAGVPVLAGTSTIPPSISAFIKQADEVGVDALIIADGLGWVGEWYSLTGSSSNYVIDQIPGWTTEAAQAFAADFEAKKGIAPSPSAAGLSYDWTNFFIKVLETTLQDSGELTSEALYKTAQEKLWTGQLTYDEGIIMSEYRYAPDTIPDPVVGQDAYVFPVIQYMDGKSNVIWPDAWKTADIQAKP
ncbi:MAG TPA: ABC transporter substrate-binding protein [Candidatus Limnocylindrales bacterium]|nr:ABC transporter substrate-binding protein [Candidatus Limnocylindrales bacterium]